MFKFEFPSEKAFEDYVWHEIKEHKVCPVSGDEVDYAYRQLALDKYGITDIIKVEVMPLAIHITVLELKNEPLKEIHLSQLARYMRGIKRLVERYKRITKGKGVWVFGQLAGPLNASQNDLVFLASHLEGIEIFDVGVSMESGFHSAEVGDNWCKPGDSFEQLKPVVRRTFDSWLECRACMVDLDALEFSVGEF